MAYKSAARAIVHSSIVCVDVGDHVMCDERLEVAGGDRTGIHRSVVYRLGIGQYQNHFVRALREGTFDGLGCMNLARPLVGAYRIAMQRVDNGVTPAFLS